MYTVQYSAWQYAHDGLQYVNTHKKNGKINYKFFQAHVMDEAVAV